MLLVSHAGPTVPELPPEDDDDDELLLDELLVPLEPLLDAPLVPLEPLELVDEPVSGVVAASVAGAPASSLAVVFGGSVVVLLPASGAGSAADFVSSTVLPRVSTGDVAQADARATSDDNAATAMRVERRMAGTLAAELCTLPRAQPNETLR
ncbi:MAG: hypothetical protein QOI41_3009 [Myxococcales bacterium]|nr:hypothetical protein [Myxococcales bacterium]